MTFLLRLDKEQSFIDYNRLLSFYFRKLRNLRRLYSKSFRKLKNFHCFCRKFQFFIIFVENRKEFGEKPYVDQNKDIFW